MFTQIYSLQTPEEALACVEAGADRIGVLVNEEEGPYPCPVTEAVCAEIFKAVRGKAVCVLISVKNNEDDILRETALLKPDVLHLCAEFEGSAAFKARLNKEVPGVKLMEAVGISDDWSAVEEAKRKESYADILIMDSVSKTVPGVGAAGITHDWNIDAEIVKQASIPVILAGGLGPDNVAEAIEKVHPDGVDSLTKTSVKKDGVLLHKDIEKVREFCRIAHSFN